MKLPLAIGLFALLAAVVVGAVATDFTAYLGDDPTTCNNCHVMDAVYENWFHAGHHASATCNDCHTPHEFIPKYVVKAINGFNHVGAFTLGRIPEAIRAKERSRRVVQANCIRCHGETASSIADGQMNSGRVCFECHRQAVHGPRGISLLPYQDKAH
jgi:cytochrome c nitrite reductase small subunit